MLLSPSVGFLFHIFCRYDANENDGIPLAFIGEHGFLWHWLIITKLSCITAKEKSLEWEPTIRWQLYPHTPRAGTPETGSVPPAGEFQQLRGYVCLSSAPWPFGTTWADCSVPIGKWKSKPSFYLHDFSVNCWFTENYRKWSHMEYLKYVFKLTSVQNSCRCKEKL